MHVKVHNLPVPQAGMRGLSVFTAKIINAWVARRGQIQHRRDCIAKAEPAPHRAFMEFSPQQIRYGIRNPAKAPKRILVIDDDAGVGAAIQAILGRHRYQTLLASRSSDGIQALRQSQFELVMLDIFMPGLNGLDVLDRIRRDFSIPVIVMSGFRLRSTAQPVDYLAMASERGATLCMRKPFSTTELIDAVEWATGLQAPSERLSR